MGLRERLIKEEGLKLFPYKDTKGIWTIGVGHNMEPDMMPHLDSLQKDGITKQQALDLLDADINIAKSALARALPWTVQIDDARRDVLIDMVFNMGIGTVLKFKNALAAIQAGRWGDAATEMLDSAWASQVGKRAQVLAEIVETGDDLA